MNRFAARYRKVNERDRLFIMSLNLKFLDRVVLPLYVGFLCLDFLDVYSTLLALRSAFDFHELNPIASTLFGMHFDGFLIAIALKYLPVIPLFFLAFVTDSENNHPLAIRIIRFDALIVLVAVDIYLGYVVVWNNLPTLIGFLMR